MKITIKKIIRCKWFVSFLIGSLAISLALSYSQLLMNGKYCILLGDNNSIYTPVILQFIRNLREGNGIFYSWTNSFGMNTSLINAFSAYNPFNLIYLFFPNLNPEIFTAFCIIVKTGIAAMCFQLFCEKTFNIHDNYSILFSVMYSMCAFQIDSNVINIIWLDALFLLPLVFMFIYILVIDGKCLGLIFTLSYLFITNFYMGYIVGIAAIIYFILLLIFIKNKKKSNLIIVFRFFISGLISVMISAFAWYPAACFMLNNYAADSTKSIFLYANLADVISQMFIGKDTGTKGFMPDLYCGILTLLILPFFFISKKISLNIKIIYGVLFGFYIISIFCRPLYIFVHAFDSPDGWYFRFAFIVSFLMCAMSVQAYKYLADINSKILIIYSVVVYFINVIVSIFQPIRFTNSFFKPLIVYLVINAVFVLIWNLIILFRDRLILKNKKSFSALVLSIVIVELVLNCFSAFNGVLELRKDNFNAWDHSQKCLIEFLDNDDSFYRVSYYNNLFTNGDTWYGYNGMTDFNTAENPNLRYLLTDLGVYSSPRVVQNFGTNRFLDMILGVKYTVVGVNPYTFEYKKYTPKIIKNDYIGIGFIVDKDILNCKLDSNAFENNNNLASSLVGEHINVFDVLDKKDVSVICNGIELLETNDGRYYLSAVSDDGEEGVISFIVNKDINDSDIYMYIDNEESIIYKRSFLYADGYENSCDIKGFTSLSYLKKFEEEDDYKYVSIYKNDIKQQVMNDYYFGCFNVDNYNYIYNKLSEHIFEIDEVDNNHILGSIDTIQDDSILFTSVPYSKDWKVFVDGEQSSIISLLNDSFIGINIKSAGTHIIEMRFRPAGLTASLIICGLGILLFVIYIIIGTISKENL